MDHFAGLDVSVKETSICIVDDTGRIVREAKVASEPEALLSVLKNPDGTVDIYFGSKPPAGQASNWLYTQPGQKWFPWFRVYGPEKAIFDKSWKLPDIEMMS